MAHSAQHCSRRGGLDHWPLSVLGALCLTLFVTSPHPLLPQAFEIVTRPALDSVESALDRLKMGIYVNFARWGLPCPITGAPASVGQGALEAQQQQAAAAAAAAAQQQAAAAS